MHNANDSHLCECEGNRRPTQYDDPNIAFLDGSWYLENDSIFGYYFFRRGMIREYEISSACESKVMDAFSDVAVLQLFIIDVSHWRVYIRFVRKSSFF